MLKKQTELMTWYMYYCSRLGTWVVGSESDVEDARDGGCRGHVVINTADDDAVQVSCTGVPTPAPTAGRGLGETDAAARAGLTVAAAALFFL